jgi:hypothetical protein
MEPQNERIIAMINDTVMQKFCSKEEDKEIINSAFLVDDYTYATNGMIIIRIKSYMGAILKNCLPIDVVDWESISRVKKLEPIAKDEILKLRDENKCPCCDPNVLEMPGECRECEGIDTVLLSNSFNTYEVECLSCGGMGDHPPLYPVNKCPGCQGTRARRRADYNLHGTNVALWLIVLAVENLNDVKFPPGTYKKNEPIPFLFDGGEGFLMPIKENE